MKRVALLIFVFLLIYPTALADEILFRGIPWYSSFEKVQESFGEDIPVDGVDGIDMFLVDELNADFANINSVDSVNYPSGWMGVSPVGWFDFKAGGHLVDTLYVLCSYGFEEGRVLTSIDSSRLYLAAYQFSNGDEAAYLDLQKKLTTLYGTGNETNEDVKLANDLILRHSTRWDGDNGTAAVLTLNAYKNGDGSYLYSNLWLTYSIAGADEIIKVMASEVIADPNDLTGL
ncbi:MAG: hypothetical protein IJQ62_13680 [Clostridia bacterium]|nr:hypothetical protein [Clostridia bacterium]